MIVHVGSTRPAKVEGAREALQAIARVDPRFHDFTLHTHDLTLVAPRQPMSLDAIVEGAVARASTLARTVTGSQGAAPGFFVGVEGGLHRVGTGIWSLHTWAAVTDGQQWGYGAGPAIALPPGIVERVVAGEELGDVIDGLVGASVRGTRGAWGVLTRDLIGRREAFRLAVTAAFARFYNGPAWGG